MKIKVSGIVPGNQFRRVCVSAVKG